MLRIIKDARELMHPGFIVFDGLDFTGKTFLAKRASAALKTDNRFKLNAKYNHNHGFLNQSIVDEQYFKSLNLKDRFDYLLQCYSKDILPADSKSFTEIFQDRHLPYLFYYGLTQGHKKISDISYLIRNIEKPKHTFLIECDYKTRKKRTIFRGIIKDNEKKSLESENTHNYSIHLYRSILDEMGLPYTIIDTSRLPEDELVASFLDNLEALSVLSQPVNLESLAVDHETNVFQSTFRFKLEQIQKGANLPPIPILRKIGNDQTYVDLIEDGRHRAFAALKAGRKTILAYVSYQAVEKINPERLTSIKNFTFRENDNGQVIDGRLIY